MLLHRDRICKPNFLSHLTNTDTDPTSLNTDPIKPSVCQSKHYNAKFYLVVIVAGFIGIPFGAVVAT